MTGGDISSFLLDVRKGEEDVVTFDLPTEPLKTCSGLESVVRYELSTYQHVGRSHSQYHSVKNTM